MPEQVVEGERIPAQVVRESDVGGFSAGPRVPGPVGNPDVITRSMSESV